MLAASTCSAILATLPAGFLAYPACVVPRIDAYGDFPTPHTRESGHLDGLLPREIFEAIAAVEHPGLELAEFAASGDERTDAHVAESIVAMIAPVR
ncbi:hypothetical protein [Amycolatopsis rubida]|uniref:Arginase family protein n=1 Tax=Amycolatopsis rubida TaxID=112413 RepID=A0A1I6BLR6_9PSEU|nr:hypothetical protein [Amycolatopsis rubida]SFQ81876.1 hypothetical protein SAMN05421854_13119 [Amycolatopsis rubida]